MATSTQSRKPVKPSRHVRLVSAPTPARPVGLLAITVGNAPTSYLIESVPADFGSAFALTKLVMAEVEPGVREQQVECVYHVHFDATLGDSCDCRGFIRWHRCKHRDAVAELLRRGVLTPAPAGPDAA